MSTHRKVYRFRMRPTQSQECVLNRLAGARRWVWNWALRRWRDHHETTGKSIPMSMLSAELTALKALPETAWLKECDAQSLQQSLRDLQRAFVNFFEKRACYPRFKSRKRDPLRFRIPQRVKVADGKVYVPKAGWVRLRQSQPITETTKSASFHCSASGYWYVSLVVEFVMPDTPLPQVNPDKVVGIDLGLKDFAIFSDDTENVPSPKFFQAHQRKLRRAQRTLSRRKPGSNRRAKAKLAVAKVHQKISDHRSDFLHKLTTELVRNHDGLCIEDLCVKGLARTKLAKSVNDASWGEFRRQVEYKSEWSRKHLAIIDRWFPSSKMCRDCKAINAELTLKERVWTCACGVTHDRDKNAARNIYDEGIRILAAGHAESLNAQGTYVRPATAGNGC